jgi:ABC-2 type transport system permease protein
MLGAFLFQMIGFVVASFSKTADAAQGMATAITIPMMFLAGVFFPIDSLPKWLYTFVQYLPLAPLLRIIRVVMLENSSPFFEPKNFIILVSWIVIALSISIYKFKLSDE